MKTIFIIGGGEWQVPIVKKAKSLGFKVINSNLYKNSPAFKYADYSYVADVLDKKINLEIAKKHNVDAVITDQSDIAVNTVAFINETLELNGIGIKKAKLFTNKLFMRQYLQIEHLHHPQYTMCYCVEDVKNFYKQIDSTIILKPVDSQSSRGIKIVNNFKEIDDAFEYTKENTKHSYILAEEFIGGFELTVEGYKKQGDTHKTLAISKKKYFTNIIGIASRLYYFNKCSGIDIKKITKINDSLYDEIPFAITHTEYKYYNGKFYLIEAAVRGGGTKISSDIIPSLSGYDVNKALIYDSLNISCDCLKVHQENIFDHAVLQFFNFKEGYVKSIDGLDQLKQEKNLIDIKLEFNIGDYIYKPTDDRSRVGYFIAKGKTFADISSIYKKINKVLKVEIDVF